MNWGRRPGYSVRPSQTRMGQHVDNPILENSDTQRLKVLLLETTSDQWEHQHEINGEVGLVLEKNKEWRNGLYQRGDVVCFNDLRLLEERVGNLKLLLWLLGGTCVIVAGILYSMINDVNPHG